MIVAFCSEVSSDHHARKLGLETSIFGGAIRLNNESKIPDDGISVVARMKAGRKYANAAGVK